MSVDLLGPASSPNAVTVRPSETRTFGTFDSFFKDCTSSAANDGTIVPAAWLNMLTQQIRRAIRGMGVAEDNADDDMLLKAIQAVGANFVTFAMAHNLPIFPHAFGSGSLTVTGSVGSIVIGAGQVFQHRGVFQISTDNYDLAHRTFATVANKTYHLRWKYNSGTPTFALYDVTDGTYNPGALAESSGTFDSTFDDMLIAKVVTDGGNNPTITALINRAFLGASAELVGDGTSYWISTGITAAVDYAVTLNWARTPSARSLTAYLYNATVGTTNRYVSGGTEVTGVSATRYKYTFTILRNWYEGAIGITLAGMQSQGYATLAA